jgi:alginate O-acetyltransferase complex protein AlgI
MLTGLWHGAGWNYLLWGLWFAFWLILEKLFLGRVLPLLPRAVGFLYNSLVVLAGWVFFALESPGQISSYFKAMAGRGGALSDNMGKYLGAEYAVLFLLALAAATPIPGKLIKRLENSGSGMGLTLYRAGEKLIPAALLILSVAGIVDATYNPFLYFRF